MRGPAILLSIAAGAFCAPAAMAQDAVATQNLPVTGSAPQVCALQQGTVRTGDLVNFRGTDGDSLRVLRLVDPRTLATQAARATILLDGVCNFPHRVRIESQDNGLWPIEGPLAATTPEFATALPYRIEFVWADRTGELEADAKVRRSREVRADVDSAAAGELQIGIELDAGASNTQLGAPVMAGNYVDTLRIFLEPR